MFVINGIATHTEPLFADSIATKTCSFCSHSRTFSEKSSNNKCDFCGHTNKRISRISKKNSKKVCRFCGHSFRSNEYSNKKDRYKSFSSDYKNYDDEEEMKKKSGYIHSDIGKAIKEKYTLDLSGVFFHKNGIGNSTLENENGYEDGQFSLSFGKEGDETIDYSNQHRRVRSLDEWDDNRESDNYEDSEYDESQDETQEDEESFIPTEEQTTVLPQQMTDIGASQLPVAQPLSTELLPTTPTERTTPIQISTNGMQHPTLPQTQQQYSTLDQPNQTVKMDPNVLLTQYPYGQSSNSNNINFQQNLLLQAGQENMNGLGSNQYGQMSDGSVMPQLGGMSQQAYTNVVNETIEYLRNLGILDENRVSKMSAGMVDGECIICMRPKFVFQIRGQGMRGVCEDCLRSRNSYGEAFSSGGIKGVLERGVMSVFGSRNDDNRSSSYGIRNHDSGGGYGNSSGNYEGGYSYNSSVSEGTYGNNGMSRNIPPSQGGMSSLMSITSKLTERAGNGLEGMLGTVGNMLGSGTSRMTGKGNQQMVMNAFGQLVPMGSDPSAPYGYVKDPTTGQMRPASSPEEGSAAAVAGATTVPSIANGAAAGMTTRETTSGVAGNTGIAGTMAAATEATNRATSTVSTAANATTGALEKATNSAVGVANTAVNAANNAAATVENTVSHIANSAEAIKNAAQPLASLTSSVGSLVSTVASGIKSKVSTKKEDTSADSSDNSPNQAKSKQDSVSNSPQTKKKKKRKASSINKATSPSGIQQQSTKKKKKKKS